MTTPLGTLSTRHTVTDIIARAVAKQHGVSPGCESFYHAEDTDAGTLYLVDQHHRSWATLHTTTKPPYEVRQGGQRKLWGKVQTAYRWWIDAGEPTVNAWRFTVAPSGQRIELH